MNDYQAYGSGVTYFRRYALSSMLGLITDKDIDAAGTQIKESFDTKLIDSCNTEEELIKLHAKYKSILTESDIKSFTNRKLS